MTQSTEKNDLIAAREFIRMAWYELNAINAQYGAKHFNVSQEHWDNLLNSLEFLLAQDTVPWMTNAARELIAPYEIRIQELEEMSLRLYRSLV